MLLRPIKKIQLGKKGLTTDFISQVEKIFEKEKILKITILKTACRDKEEAKEIAEKLMKTLGKKYNYKLIGYVLTLMKFRKDQR
jgi:RNA-binding protein YhbY